ncbi:TPA: hypothetical protein SMT61_000729 [Proteus mirabilis]|uniref:hypothetical protein n=1 Tax=unclassified Proteus (in: enterobacteria) TaxID=257482 RepID=UPI0013767394|nr:MULTISPECIES: hypothetical protein [unclassified Proteus (in: enterobacteria)]NBM73901.1 hypothetical protein [Proteus sp. G4406]NBN27732.1 hypothetical protein [Proteus sp. G4408]HEK1156768.1 hypothetical protein [Proteus mirabilis]HEK2777818.1 hypothetical protein [Proteus mirabilis]
MQNKFVHLFESGNYQLLVKKTESEDGEPKLSLITQYDGAEVDFGIVMNNEDDLVNAFNNYEQIKAGAEKYLNELNQSTSLQDFIKRIY